MLVTTLFKWGTKSIELHLVISRGLLVFVPVEKSFVFGQKFLPLSVFVLAALNFFKIVF
jgi:hypothetical protein